MTYTVPLYGNEHWGERRPRDENMNVRAGAHKELFWAQRSAQDVLYD